VTSNRALAVLLVAPLVILSAIGIGLTIDSGQLWPLELMTAFGAGTSALIFGVAWLVASQSRRDHAQVFEALATALGGSVLKNWIGERQLRVPLPRGRLELEYRVYSRDGESHEPYTRVALVLSAGALPKERRDMLEDPSAARRLGPTSRAEVEALHGRVRLLGRGKEPSVELWAFGWLGAQEAVRLVERARPHLEALTARAWSA